MDGLEACTRSTGIIADYVSAVLTLQSRHGKAPRDPNGPAALCRAVDQAKRTVARRARIAPPIAPKPMSIKAQLDVSGAASGSE